MEDGYTKEEWKMVVETKKILDPRSSWWPTCVRVPVFIGHSEGVNIELEKPLSADEAREILRAAPGILVDDKRESGGYMTPHECAGEDPVFISRLREDPTVENGLAFWCVADNLRKGAALNAVPDRRGPDQSRSAGRPTQGRLKALVRDRRTSLSPEADKIGRGLREEVVFGRFPRAGEEPALRGVEIEQDLAPPRVADPALRPAHAGEALAARDRLDPVQGRRRIGEKVAAGELHGLLARPCLDDELAPLVGVRIRQEQRERHVRPQPLQSGLSTWLPKVCPPHLAAEQELRQRLRPDRGGEERMIEQMPGHDVAEQRHGCALARLAVVLTSRAAVPAVARPSSKRICARSPTILSRSSPARISAIAICTLHLEIRSVPS